MRNSVYYFSIFILLTTCTTKTENASSAESRSQFRLITLDPGHFHAALIQKKMYPSVDTTVHVYAPQGTDLRLHLDRIEAYNHRLQDSTHWNEVVYSADDYFQRMLNEKKGNVVVLAGNNQKKTSYIHESVGKSFHVLADKPMAIDAENFELLKNSFELAARNKVVLYDIMTERYEITTVLQRELSRNSEVFGKLLKGSPDNPAVTKESVHYFHKYVSGNVLTRPAWFFDVTQEGEGIVDVTTHLVDLVQWECFPDEILDYTKDVQVLSAKRWSTDLTPEQFRSVTKVQKLPGYLTYEGKDSLLHIFSNGEINYKLKGVHAKVSVTWGYKAEEGGDTHFSVMRGSRADLVIKQGKEQGFKPTLYIVAVDGSLSQKSITLAFEKIQGQFPGVSFRTSGKGWEVVIPEKYKEGHEEHFGRVAEKFFDYLEHGNMPGWEVPNMIAKYYTTTKALEIARQNKTSNPSQ